MIRSDKNTKDKDWQEYKDAVWNYMLEHCDITENGAFFVKFHTKSKKEFEKHVKARWIYGYERVDERSGMSREEKEQEGLSRQEKHRHAKAEKKRKHIADREIRKAAIRKAEKENRLRRKLGPFYKAYQVLREKISPDNNKS